MGSSTHILVIHATDVPRVDRRGVAMERSARPVHPSPLLTEAEAALYLARSISSLRRERKTGRGPAFVRLGRSVRYPSLRQLMDDWFCESRHHRREAQLRAGSCAVEVRALASAPGELFFP
jgi:hypothetical protein